MTPPRTRLAADLALLAVVAAWGYTFVPIKAVTEQWPRHWMTFVALRFWVATLAFVPLLGRARPAAPRRSLAPGLLTGLTMLLGYGFQTAGLVYTTPTIAGFITALSVVLVPVGARLLGRPVPRAAVLGMAIATAGLALLCLQPGTALVLGIGELLVLGCAVAFAGQILLTERYAPSVDPVRFTAAQCLVTAIGATGYALVLEIGPGGWPVPTGDVVFAILFCGFVGSTVSFLVQTVAQRVTPATHVALIYAMEPVFAALASWLLRDEQITARMLQGGALILAGVLCAELGPRWRKK